MEEENKKNQQQKERSTSGIPVVDLLLGLIDRLFMDGATGQVLAGRVTAIFAIFLMLFVWFKGDIIAKYYKESKFETYNELIQSERNKKFESTAKEQLQIVQIASGSDFSAIYVFRLKDLNYFVDLEFYEGRLPESLDSKNLGGYPINKASNEYRVHLAGLNFKTDKEFVYLPTTEPYKAVSYMYSCPYFDMNNIYSGSIAMYWYKMPDNLAEKRLDSICNQASRAIGRSR